MTDTVSTAALSNVSCAVDCAEYHESGKRAIQVKDPVVLFRWFVECKLRDAYTTRTLPRLRLSLAYYLQRPEKLVQFHYNDSGAAIGLAHDDPQYLYGSVFDYLFPGEDWKALDTSACHEVVDPGDGMFLYGNE